MGKYTTLLVDLLYQWTTKSTRKSNMNDWFPCQQLLKAVLLSFVHHFCLVGIILRTYSWSLRYTFTPVLLWRFTVTMARIPLSTSTEKTTSFSTSWSHLITFCWNSMDVFAVHLLCWKVESLQHLYDTQYRTSPEHSGALVFTGSHCRWIVGLSMKTSTNLVLHSAEGA